MALRQVAADLLAIFRIAVIEHYLPAVATGRLDLHRRRVGRHHDGRRDPQQARRGAMAWAWLPEENATTRRHAARRKTATAR